MVQFDYTNQAWIRNGKYIRCGHPGNCTMCYGTIHEGQTAPKDFDRHAGRSRVVPESTCLEVETKQSD